MLVLVFFIWLNVIFWFLVENVMFLLIVGKNSWLFLYYVILFDGFNVGML